MLWTAIGPALFHSTPRAAQSPAFGDDPRRFLNVEEWKLAFTFESDDPARYRKAGEDVDRSVYRERQSGTVTLRAVSARNATGDTSRHYIGEGSMTCSLEWVQKSTAGTWETDTQARGGGTTTVQARLDYDTRKNTYRLQVVPRAIDASKHSVVRDLGRVRNDVTSVYQWLPRALPFPATRDAPSLPSGGMVLTGTYSLEQQGEANRRNPEAARPYPPSVGTGTWRLTAASRSDPVELVVDAQGYKTWRPQAALNEITPGNHITIEAKLQRPGGGETNTKARKITFELADTSREPGIAMNFPVRGAGSEFDLQFSPALNPPDRYTIARDNQRIETVPGSYTSAPVVVSSYDWGGWSTLKVSAELENGDTVTGHLMGESGTTDILLPKRAKNSTIADIWKENAGSLGDNDDSETGPAGASSPGDGFTLYEEYRGFYENGQHVSGDPKKIDFFVRNYIGTDARAGIDLFAGLTGAVVHARLRDAEFDRSTRVMNGNHARGKHRNNQHGVFLETQPTLNGGLTVLSRKGVRGRPAIASSINLQPRCSLTSMITSENVPPSDLALAYDRAVAHEMMHSVGAEHHGAGDGRATFRFVFADDPKNTIGRAHYFYVGAIAGTGWPATIIDEGSRRELASLREGDMLMNRERLRPLLYPDLLSQARQMLAERQGYNIPETAEQIAEHDLDMLVAPLIMWYVGSEHGECSGDELCLMRYYFAKLYEKKGQENAFYYITKSRTERAGRQLCRLATGTGVNVDGRTPQPRYGDAATTRGACAGSIVFNDALPLKSDVIPPAPGR